MQTKCTLLSPAFLSPAACACAAALLTAATATASMWTYSAATATNGTLTHSTSEWKLGVTCDEKNLTIDRIRDQPPTPAPIPLDDAIDGGYTVTSIGDMAFYRFPRQTHLTTITIPNTVTNIGDRAFNYCFSLTRVTLGDSVTRLASNPFFACKGLTAFSVSENNAAYASIDGILYNKGATTLLQ